jgi:hypothetical protein
MFNTTLNPDGTTRGVSSPVPMPGVVYVMPANRDEWTGSPHAPMLAPQTFPSPPTWWQPQHQYHLSSATPSPLLVPMPVLPFDTHHMLPSAALAASPGANYMIASHQPQQPAQAPMYAYGAHSPHLHHHHHHPVIAVQHSQPSLQTMYPQHQPAFTHMAYHAVPIASAQWSPVSHAAPHQQHTFVHQQQASPSGATPHLPVGGVSGRLSHHRSPPGSSLGGGKMAHAKPTQPTFLHETFRAAVADLSREAQDPSGLAMPHFEALLSAVHGTDATDADVHRTLLSMRPSALCHALLSLCATETLDSAPCLRRDLIDLRGAVTVALIDVLLLTHHRVSEEEFIRSEPGSTVLRYLARVVLPAITDLAATQRGCVTIMRLVSCVHHVSALLTPLIAALTRCIEFLLLGAHSPYVLCHVLAGLCRPALKSTYATIMPSPPTLLSSADLVTVGSPDWCARRSAYIIEFAPWIAAVTAAPSEDTMVLLRDLCDTRVWDGFVSAVLAALRVHADTVLRGRQQCFVLWHALRRVDVLRHADGLALLGVLATPTACVAWPQQQHMSPSNATTTPSPATFLVPLAALCRSTAGRCAMAALLHHVAVAVKDVHALDAQGQDVVRRCIVAVRRVAEGGIPTIDKGQEASLKMRPGMEVAATVESSIRELLRNAKDM